MTVRAWLSGGYRQLVILLLALLVACAVPTEALARLDAIKTQQKISDTAGGFTGLLSNADEFGRSVTSLGDIDGDGVSDLAAGAIGDDDGGPNRGAVWVLFLNADGTVRTHQKISSTSGGFLGNLDDGDEFGSSLASLGDLDGDGVTDIAVGAWLDDDTDLWRPLSGPDSGAVWVLFLNPDGTVKAEQKISALDGFFDGALRTGDRFGASVTMLGDVDGDGVDDLAVGATADRDGGTSRGAVWVLFLNSDGTVKAEQKISSTHGGFTGELDTYDFFGVSLSSIGDLDADGVTDLAVGAGGDDDGMPSANRGAVWLLFLENDGTVKSHQKLSDTAGGFKGLLHNFDVFGRSVDWLGDRDGDGVSDIAVGARGDNDGGDDRGAVWMLYLNGDGTVKSHQKVSSVYGDFGGELHDHDQLGTSVAWIADMDGDGLDEISAGAPFDADGGNTRGAIWTAFPGEVPEIVCGNGAVEAGEACDDGNDISHDGCSAECTWEQSEEQQDCIVEMNRGGAKVAKTQARENTGCIKRVGREKITGAQACLTADGKGKVQKAKERVVDVEAKDCVLPPDFAYSGAENTWQAAVDETAALMGDLFGSNLDAAIILLAIDKPAAKCQAGVVKILDKIVQAKLRLFTDCKRDGLQTEEIGSDDTLAACFDDVILDEQERVAKAIGKLSSTVSKKCGGVALGGTFPGACIGAGEFVPCVDERINCRVCRMVNSVDAIAADCDLVDDGIANASCEQ